MARRPIAPKVPDPPLPVQPSRKEALRYRLLAVEQMILRPTAESSIVQFARQHWGIGKEATLRLIARVYARWSTEDERNRPREKAAQVRRLKGYIARMSAKDPKEWNVAGIIQVERLLADVAGTREPVKVEHDFTRIQSVDGVVASLSPEKFAAAVAEARAQKQLADKARILLKLTDGTEVLGK